MLSLKSKFYSQSLAYLLSQSHLVTSPQLMKNAVTHVLKLSAELSQAPLYCDCFSLFFKVQTAIEELLSVGCDTEPTSAKILFRDGFEKEGSNFL